MKRKECISVYVLFSIILGAAVGLALGVAFDRIVTFTIGGAVLGVIIGLFTANDKRFGSSKKEATPKKKTTKKAKKTTKK